MATGKSLELRAIGGGTYQMYLKPGARLMNRQARCPGCHRKHKKAHEDRVVGQSQKKPYTPACTVYHVKMRQP